jgi:hypothetical protein
MILMMFGWVKCTDLYSMKLSQLINYLLDK